MTVNVSTADKKIIPPRYATPDAAGADIAARLDVALTIPPGGRIRVPTGLFLEIPRGYEAQIRPRSGLAFKHGVTILNAPGTIDADYRGELSILLINLGDEPFTIRDGDRIAQMVLSPVVQADFSVVPDLSASERGGGGFGSTGV